MRALLLCLILLIPTAPLAQDADQPTGTISVEESGAKDAAIAGRIRDILAELEGYGKVSVTVRSGIVTLQGTTPDSASARRLTPLVARVEGVVAVENEVAGTTDVVERLNPTLTRFQKRIGDFIAFLPILLVATAAFAAIVALGMLLARLRRPWDRLAPNAFIADIYRQVLRLAFVVAALVVALDILGATALLSTVLGAAGIVGLAIGFAVRDTVENFIASILLSVRQPFRPKDLVEIEGDIGRVIRLTGRATILLSQDGNHIRIPNATVFKARIVNYTRNDERRFVFDLAVAAGSDLSLARQVATDTLCDLPFVLASPGPEIWVESAGDGAVTLRVTGWIAQSRSSIQQARSEAIRLTMLALQTAGIALSEPSLLVTRPEADAPPSAASAPPAPPAAAAMRAADVTATAEAELERIVEDERRSLPQDDLLDRQAPNE